MSMSASAFAEDMKKQAVFLFNTNMHIIRVPEVPLQSYPKYIVTRCDVKEEFLKVLDGIKIPLIIGGREKAFGSTCKTIVCV